MKILFFTNREPFPPHRGDQVIAYNQIKKIKKDFPDIKVWFVFLYLDEELNRTAIKEIKPYCEGIYSFRMKKLKHLFKIFKTLINLKPFQVNFFYDRTIKLKIDKLVKEIDPDIIHIQTARTAEYFKKSSYKKVINYIDSLGLNMKRRAQNDIFLKKPIFHLEAYLMNRYEKTILEFFDKGIVVSALDKDNINSQKIDVIPNGIDSIEKINIIKEKIIVFHGNMSYFPNYNSIIRFIENVWNKIYRDFPDYYLYIVGREPHGSLQKYHGFQNIIITGYVENIYSFLKKSEIGVYPLLSGTGIQNKILEAFTCGLPVVATDFAMQGFSDISDNTFLRANSFNEIYKKLSYLLSNRDLQKRLSEHATNYVHSNYSWDKNVNELIDVWKSAFFSKKRYNDNKTIKN